MKQELENSHTEQLQCVKQQYEMSLEGAYSTQLQTFSEAALWVHLKLTDFFFFYFIMNLCCTVLSFLKYFWCHNTCKLFRAQQSPQSGGAVFGQNFERYRSRSICKLDFLSLFIKDIHTNNSMRRYEDNLCIEEPVCNFSQCLCCAGYIHRDRLQCWLWRTKP